MGRPEPARPHARGSGVSQGQACINDDQRSDFVHLPRPPGEDRAENSNSAVCGRAGCEWPTGSDQNQRQDTGTRNSRE